MTPLPRIPRMLAVFLVALGIVTIALAGGLRGVNTVTSKTTETVAGKQVKVESTQGPFVSDAMFVAATALGGVLILCGVFSRWISKITLPGGAGFEFAPREYWDDVVPAGDSPSSGAQNESRRPLNSEQG